MATRSSILAWKIPWTEDPGRLQSMGLQSQTRLSDFTSLLFLAVFLFLIFSKAISFASQLHHLRDWILKSCLVYNTQIPN